MSKEEYDKLEQLLHRLCTATTDPGEVHVCPLCNGRLYVRFELYTRGDKNMLGLQASCESCDAAMAVDCYVQPPPKWLNG